MKKYIVTLMLPAEKKDGTPRTDKDGNVIYEKNYLCSITRHKQSGAVVNVWDTNKKYCFLFRSKKRAREIQKALGAEGSKVEEFIIVNKISA